MVAVVAVGETLVCVLRLRVDADRNHQVFLVPANGPFHHGPRGEQLDMVSTARQVLHIDAGLDWVGIGDDGDRYTRVIRAYREDRGGI